MTASSLALLDAERKAQAKWLPPMAVGLDGQTVPTVIHPVTP